MLQGDVEPVDERQPVDLLREPGLVAEDVEYRGRGDDRARFLVRLGGVLVSAQHVLVVAIDLFDLRRVRKMLNRPESDPIVECAGWLLMRKMLFDPARQKLTFVEQAGHRQERRAVAKPDLGIVSARAEPRDVTASTTEALSIRFQNRNESLLETVERGVRGFVPGNRGRRPRLARQLRLPASVDEQKRRRHPNDERGMRETASAHFT